MRTILIYFWDNLTKSFEVDEPKLRENELHKDVWTFYGSGPDKPAQPDEPKDFYCQHYYKAVDHVVDWIKERFN